MNCRPGDLARVIAPGRMTRCPLCGIEGVAIKPDTMVVVTTHDGIAWRLDKPVLNDVQLSCGVAIYIICHALSDDILRPIRDPGDNAVDEMLIRVGLPTDGVLV